MTAVTNEQYISYAVRVTKSNVTDEEKALCVRWAAARVLMDEAEREVEKHFMSLLKQALKEKDFDWAEALIQRCPSDTVTRVFMVDQLRHARKKGG